MEFAGVFWLVNVMRIWVGPEPTFVKLSRYKKDTPSSFSHYRRPKKLEMLVGFHGIRIAHQSGSSLKEKNFLHLQADSFL